jgi:hypothetical protein
MTALDQAERQRWQALSERLIAATVSTGEGHIQELSDGYAFRFPAEALVIQVVAEWITLERLCCPFFRFELVVEAGGPAWLKLRAGDGIKPFIEAEFGLRA